MAAQGLDVGDEFVEFSPPVGHLLVGQVIGERGQQPGRDLDRVRQRQGRIVFGGVVADDPGGQPVDRDHHGVAAVLAFGGSVQGDQ